MLPLWIAACSAPMPASVDNPDLFHGTVALDASRLRSYANPALA